MFKIKFNISYDGTHYFGWQRQSNHTTVQEEIEKVLTLIFAKEIKIIGAGRTDRGVHAKGQVATCELPKQTDLHTLLKSLNSLLPDDILILSIDEANKDFHPRYSATGKIYRYHVYTKKLLDPFRRHTCYHHPYPVDLSLIKKTIPLFLGKKDFTSFANYGGKNSNPPNPVKTIYSIDFEETDDGFTLTFHGDGFLYKMVRNLTGAMLSVAEKRISLKELETILEKKNSAHGLYQAPAQGLCLESVQYD